MNRTTGRLSRVGVAVCLTALLLWRSDPAQVWQVTAAANAGWILSAVLLVIVDRALMAYRWFALLSPIEANVRPPFGAVMRGVLCQHVRRHLPAGEYRRGSGARVSAVALRRERRGRAGLRADGPATGHRLDPGGRRGWDGCRRRACRFGSGVGRTGLRHYGLGGRASAPCSVRRSHNSFARPPAAQGGGGSTHPPPRSSMPCNATAITGAIY